MTRRSGHTDRTLDLSVRSLDDSHMSLCIQPEPPDLNGRDTTGRCRQTDRTLSFQRPVVSSKVPEMIFFDQTCSVMLDRTLPAFGHIVTSFCTARQHDRTLPSSVQSLSDPASGQFTDVSILLQALTGRAGPSETSIRSLRDERD